MKILVLSDTHLGKPGWDGETVFEKAWELARSTPIDVVIHGGDLVEPGTDGTLQQGLAALKAIRARCHLWVAGNNDIEGLLGVVSNPRAVSYEYAAMLSLQARKFGVHVLDDMPVEIDGIGFVGNFVGYSLSLWRPPTTPDAKFPSTIKGMVEQIEGCFPMGGSAAGFFERCRSKLDADLQMMSGCRKLVVFTHTVPTPEMILYGRSPKSDWQNAFMGWDDHLWSTPITDAKNLELQLCGHTHRQQRIERQGSAPLINVSGDGQPHVFEV